MASSLHVNIEKIIKVILGPLPTDHEVDRHLLHGGLKECQVFLRRQTWTGAKRMCERQTPVDAKFERDLNLFSKTHRNGYVPGSQKGSHPYANCSRTTQRNSLRTSAQSCCKGSS